MPDLVTWFKFFIRALGAVAFVALLATSLPHGSARAAGPATASGPAIDPANLDPTCKPCDDFYQFATGGWIKSHPLPPGRASWGGFGELAQRNRDVLHGILEEAAKVTNAAPGSDTQKLGSFYRACMDEPAIEQAGTAPIAPLLETVNSVHDVPSLVSAIATLPRAGVSTGLPLGPRPDINDSSRQIASIGLGGLGLDRDYYLTEGKRFETIRSAYRDYIASELAGLGESRAQAESDAAAVIGLETSLAKATPKREDLRGDPNKTYNPTPVAKLATLAPHIPWPAYFSTYGVPRLDSVNLTVPAYVTAYDASLAATPLETWKAYLRYRTVDAYAEALPKRFSDPQFAFRSGVLLGVKERLPRWERCTTATDAALRDVLGKAYVAAAFPPAAKTRAQALVDNLQATLRDDIGTLSWMSPPTKAEAAAKLAAFTKKIAYPDKWEDYSGLQIPSGAAYAANLQAVRRWNEGRSIARIGKPTDRGLWGMTPPTVNAYYNSSNNEIVFPAGILAPPFFYANADDAVNYGAIGAVIGHEMTHGFDNSGRRFDGAGNVRDWWTPADAAAFDARAKCIVDEYSAFEPAPGTHGNGKLEQGEAIADLGGLTIAYKAFEKTPEAKAHKLVDGYTPEQRFFLAFAQVWRTVATDGAIRQQAETNEHPWGKFRVIGTLSNMPEFQSAFHCAATDAMVRKERCQIW